ncbi:MAG TPA: ATP-binding protein [Aggregatilineales bacterium]|nr:ATP-binding protein [Aggregatilineales bacterium]
MREFFFVNRQIVLFVYGLSFFVMGLAIFLQSRRHSRLKLARDLYWLAAFGILHGIHEWGAIFIPIQSTYMPRVFVELLQTIQVVLLALSFLCLFMFGAVTLDQRFPWLNRFAIIIGIIWGLVFWGGLYLSPTIVAWQHTATIWSRYLLGLPGSILAAYGLRYQVQADIEPLNIKHIYRVLQGSGVALIAYAFLGGMVVPQGDFFPANTLNYALFDHEIGIPVQVFRSLIGLVLALTIIRALEVFEIELDRRIEQMEIERIQVSEREHIGQEIHDGAIQGVYSASLILESMGTMVDAGSEIERRLMQARSVLNAVNTDLRSYMVSLRATSPPDPLIPSLKNLIDNPRFRGLLDIKLEYEFEPNLKPMQIHQVLAITQESLSNTLRHARASHVKVRLRYERGMVLIMIEDDGRGFYEGEVAAGYGLRSMRDRAHLLGGQLEVESSPGRGTKVKLFIPQEK